MPERSPMAVDRFAREYDPGAEVITTIEKQSLEPIHITYGLGEKYIDQLIELSVTDDEIRKWCPNDADRFKSYDSYENWLYSSEIEGDVRSVYGMPTSSGDLAGFAWVRRGVWPKPLSAHESPSYTCALRIYSKYRGHGLAEELLRVTLADTSYRAGAKSLEEAGGMWATVHQRNCNSWKLYARYGFVIVTGTTDSYPDNWTLVMKYSAEAAKQRGLKF